jgi:3',5'-cyclic AMP phosphodiesterase CpdA
MFRANLPGAWPVIVAQISDLHIKRHGKLAYGVVDTAAALERSVAALNRLNPQPDLVLATGDLVDEGSEEEYGRLRDILSPLRMPVFALPGNHDERGALRQAFPTLAGDGFVQYTIEDWPVRIVVADTVIPGETGGTLCRERLAWLDARLAEQPDRPTIVALHHPPIRTGLPLMDRLGMDDAAPLDALLRRHGQVERVVAGHVHRPIQARFGGTVVSICPSTAHQLNLELRPDATPGFVLEPAGYQLHLWNDGPLVTHTAVVGDFGGPHPFRRPDGSVLM